MSQRASFGGGLGQDAVAFWADAAGVSFLLTEPGDGELLYHVGASKPLGGKVKWIPTEDGTQGHFNVAALYRKAPTPGGLRHRRNPTGKCKACLPRGGGLHLGRGTAAAQVHCGPAPGRGPHLGRSTAAGQSAEV